MTSPHLTDDEILAQAKAIAADSEYRALEEAFATAENVAITLFRESKWGDTELREKAYFLLEGIRGARVALLTAAAGKPMAEYAATVKAILNGKDPVA